MPLTYRLKLVGLIVGNSLTVMAWEFFVVNGENPLEDVFEWLELISAAVTGYPSRLLRRVYFRSKILPV
jgi:hypothetical protein